MVFPVRVLGGSGFSADVEPLDGGGLCGGSLASVDGLVHAFDDEREQGRVYEGIIPLPVFVVDIIARGVLDEVRGQVVAPVGYRGAQIGHVQRSKAEFPLADGQRQDGCGPPPVFAVKPVVILYRRNIAGGFRRDVASQGGAEAEAPCVFFPLSEGRLYRRVGRVLQYGPENIAEI